MCGIVAVIAQEDTPAVALIYEALLALQHRGQDAAGIVTEDNGRLCLHKDNGMVRDVFSQESIAKLAGDMGIGHVRYPTAGSSCSSEAQPFYVNSPFGLTLAHNGNLVNTTALQAQLRQEWRHINTGSDSEVLLNILAGAIHESLTARKATPVNADPVTVPAPARSTPASNKSSPGQAVVPIIGASKEDVLHAAKTVMRRCVGGYAVVTMITGWGILALRDPHGIRPLVYGRRLVNNGTNGRGPGFRPAEARYEYMAASESGALNALGFDLVNDVPAGHALLMTKHGEPTLHDCLPPNVPRPRLAPCLFEYVYFARPDSVLDGVSVYRTRLRMGDRLAQKILSAWPEHNIDVVVPVPDTARTAALECASALGIKYREGLIKNRYVGRTFIMPQQGLRRKSVRQKLAPINSELMGRNVLLVDDSIVRGTTSKEIINMAREAGAVKVYIASAAPPVKFPNVYGIDMPTKEELVASGEDNEPIADIETRVAALIGADRCFYQDLSDLTKSVTDEAAASGITSFTTLDSSCFDGVYATTDAVGESYLQNLATMRTSDRGSGAVATHLLDRLEIPPGKKARG